MKYRMLNYKSLFSLSVTIFIVGINAFIVPGLSTNGVVNAQEGFSNASLQGTYAETCTAGANVSAGIGVWNYDGNGNVNASGILNDPTLFGRERRTVQFVFDGTYTVNEDGTGIIFIRNVLVDGSPFDFNVDADFVIMQAESAR